MEFIETSVFSKQVVSLFTDDEYRNLQDILMCNPHSGQLIPGGSGLRKIRFAQKRSAKGKRGGARIIYYQVNESKLLMLYAYDKSTAGDLSRDQLKMLGRYVKGGVL